MVLFTYVHLAQKLDILYEYTVLGVYLYAVASDPTVTGSVFMRKFTKLLGQCGGD